MILFARDGAKVGVAQAGYASHELGHPLPQTPVTDKPVSFDEHIRLICARYAAGDTLQDVAEDLGLWNRHIQQIIFYRRSFTPLEDHLAEHILICRDVAA